MAMLEVLNKRWISQGWRAMAEEDSIPMAMVWIESLELAEIPYQHYMELYRRSVELRASRMSEGLKCDDFSVDVMIACWPGLRNELHQKQIDLGRTLTASAQTQCLRCQGTGMEQIYKDGKYVGVKLGCTHDMLDTSEVTLEGIDAALAAARERSATPMKALELCNYLRIELAKDHARSEDPDISQRAWRGSVIMGHAEKYCRENP